MRWPWRQLRRLWWFVRLVGRPHPYALREHWPSWWAYYRRFVVGPREAWMIARVVVEADDMRSEPMSVYVDPLTPCMASRRWRWPKACHLFADTLDELHAFAAKLGLKHAWFQGGRFPHYDLTPGMRTKAVAKGAVELDRRAAVMMWRARGWTRGRPAAALTSAP